MNPRNMLDEMVDYIRSGPHGVSSLELAEVFLKFKKPQSAMAHRAVSGVLHNDRRCALGQDGLWRPGKKYVAAAQHHGGSPAWAAVYILPDPSKPADRMLHISIWDPFSPHPCLLSEWLADPALLPYDERETLRGEFDGQYTGRTEALSRALDTLNTRTALFLTSRQQLFLNRAMPGEFIPEDTILLGRIFRLCGLSVPKPIDIVSCYRLLFSREPLLRSASQYGEALAECLRELVERLSARGVTSREGLDLLEQTMIKTPDWGEKAFFLADILKLPQTPAVYGFKNRAGEYVYIGKAKNARRRLLSYYHDTEESPEKLNRLRQEAYDLSMYPCGSELESLLLEHRLIKKYKPCFNTSIEINERKGTYAAVQDCIVLLAHADAGMGMSFWFRSGQKSRMQPFRSDFSDCSGMVKQLEAFFLSERLPAAFTDFAEQEIASRWIKRHGEGLCMVPVYRMATADEIFESLKCCWSECRDSLCS